LEPGEVPFVVLRQGFTPLAVCYASRTGKAWGLPLERLYQESGERMHKQEQHTADTEHGRGGTLHHLSLAKGYVCSRVAWLDDCMIMPVGEQLQKEILSDRKRFTPCP